MILCCGDALIDMLPRPCADGMDGFAPAPGGALLNSAVALGRLGVPVGMASGLSTDLFGTRLADALDTAGVQNLCHRSDRPTTLAFVTLVDGQARYAFYDETTASRMLTADDLPPPPQAALYGGISLAVEPCGTAFHTHMTRCAKAGTVCMLDPNIRPGFITDAPAYRARIADMMARADIVKLSDEDMDWLGLSAAQVLALGPALVCVTEGARGVTALTPHGALRVPAPQVTVADTVGAGDTFNAGLLAGLHDAGALSRAALAVLPDQVLTDALTLGVRAAAVTVSRPGANPPLRSEL